MFAADSCAQEYNTQGTQKLNVRIHIYIYIIRALQRLMLKSIRVDRKFHLKAIRVVVAATMVVVVVLR